MSSKFIQKVVEPGRNKREREKNSGRKNVLVGFFDNFYEPFFYSVLIRIQKFLQQHRKFANIKVKSSDMIRLYKLVFSNSLKIDLINLLF